MESKKIRYLEAATITGVAVGTLYALVARKQIPFYRLSKRLVVFDVDELNDWMQARRNVRAGGAQ